MKNTIFLAVAALTLGGAASAATGNAPFGCDARPEQTCYFRLYLGPRAIRIVQLPGGMKVTIPGVDIGHARYCVAIGKPPPYRCSQKTINATYNN